MQFAHAASFALFYVFMHSKREASSGKFLALWTQAASSSRVLMNLIMPESPLVCRTHLICLKGTLWLGWESCCPPSICSQKRGLKFGVSSSIFMMSLSDIHTSTSRVIAALGSANRGAAMIDHTITAYSKQMINATLQAEL